MKILIKQARVVDPHSPFNGQHVDIFTENGLIQQIDKKISRSADQEITMEGLCVSPGWVDLFAHFADPGFEHKESLNSGAAAAAAGGFTNVLVIPNTKPVIDTKSQVEYIIHKSSSLPVDIHPIGAITQNTNGKELAEMYDMMASGAVAFSDGIHCVQSAGLLLKALQYVKAFNGLIIQLPDDKSIHPHGLIHEGIISTKIGLPGKPAMAEELIVARDLKLARYAESRIHFTGIASKKSLEYIQRSREQGIQVSCSVTPYHLFFCDEDLTNYDSNLKVNPPLRTAADREALRMAVVNGLIDCIATHHLPHEKDSKETEFEYAQYGMTGLETTYAVLKTALPSVPDERWTELLSINPRKIAGMKPLCIRERETASITLFNPDAKWKYEEKNIRSKSRNSPFIDYPLTGKVFGIIHKDQVFLNP
jgi:dihydroorotase